MDYSSSLYTSFDAPAKRIASSEQKPRANNASTAQMKEMVIGDVAVVCFFGRDNYLSNFYASPFTLGGNTYASVEHYYEACKVRVLMGAEYARQLRGVQDAGQAKTMAKNLVSQVPRKVQDKWRMSDGILVVKVALLEKFRQNSRLLEELLKTGDRLLAQCNKHDSFWAVGYFETDFQRWVQTHKGEKFQVPDQVSSETVSKFPNVGNGKNILGFLLMDVRDQLRNEQLSGGGGVGVVPRAPLLGPDLGSNGVNAIPGQSAAPKRSFPSNSPMLVKKRPTPGGGGWSKPRF